MFGIVLESLQKTQVLRDISAHPQIVDAGMSEDLVIVDQESTSIGDASVIEDTVVRGNFFFDVG